jgi:hypothetical protein
MEVASLNNAAVRTEDILEGLDGCFLNMTYGRLLILLLETFS